MHSQVLHTELMIEFVSPDFKLTKCSNETIKKNDGSEKNSCYHIMNTSVATDLQCNGH